MKGVELRHKRMCASHSGKRCNCRPSTRATVFDASTSKLVRKTFPYGTDKQEIEIWRDRTSYGLRYGETAIGGTATVRQLGTSLIDGMRDGSILNNKGARYKPSAVRSYEQGLRDFVYPRIGATKLRDLRRRHIEDLVEGMLGKGKKASTIRNAVTPVKVIGRRALARDEITVDPCKGVKLPSVRTKVPKIVPVEHAVKLLNVLPADDRVAWALMFFAGLRCGEVQALGIRDVDLAEEMIHVRRAYDPKEKMFIDPKSYSGVRSIPMVKYLRPFIEATLIRHKGDIEQLLRADNSPAPVSFNTLRGRAYRIWEDAELESINPHSCRHTYASLSIAARVNAKALQIFMGHNDIQTTFNFYGHLMPGSENEARNLQETYVDEQLEGLGLSLEISPGLVGAV